MTAVSTPDLVSIAVAEAGTTVHLAVSGEVDSLTSPALRTALDEALAGGAAEVVVDLDGVSFLDSAGLCVLAGGHRRATELGARIRVVASTRPVVRPMQITGLWDVLSGRPA